MNNGDLNVSETLKAFSLFASIAKSLIGACK